MNSPQYNSSSLCLLNIEQLTPLHFHPEKQSLVFCIKLWTHGFSRAKQAAAYYGHGLHKAVKENGFIKKKTTCINASQLRGQPVL